MNAIEVEGLTKRYDGVLAVDGVRFSLASGRTLGLLGGNGAGKTTTIAMLLGLLIPTAGTVRILGRDMARDRFAALARMNFSSPYIALPSRLSVAENLRVYGHLYGVRGLEARIRELAAQLDLTGLLDRPDHVTGQTLGRQRGGDRAVQDHEAAAGQHRHGPLITRIGVGHHGGQGVLPFLQRDPAGHHRAVGVDRPVA